MGNVSGKPMTGPKPCSATEAVQRARKLLDHPSNAQHGYVYGGGSFKATVIGGNLVDMPWTEVFDKDGNLVGVGSDCAGFAIAWCYKLPRHRKGYNVGPWASVEDDINCNSALEDAQHQGELFELVTDKPQPGDLLVYPTFRLPKVTQPFIGHVSIVLSNRRATTWDAAHPAYELLDVAQCKGPANRKPAVVATDGSIWSHHDAMWPREEHRSHVIRAKP